MSSTTTPRRYWLLKSEPLSYGIDDLERDGTTCWDGVRNYQARNSMRDDMRVGDLAFIHHSNAKPSGIYGVAEIVREGYPDHTQFDPDDHHFDPKSSPDAPTWMMVDVRFIKRYDPPIGLAELKSTPGLESMVVLQRGSRLSVQPVTEQEWRIVEALRV